MCCLSFLQFFLYLYDSYVLQAGKENTKTSQFIVPYSLLAGRFITFKPLGTCDLIFTGIFDFLTDNVRSRLMARNSVRGLKIPWGAKDCTKKY